MQIPIVVSQLITSELLWLTDIWLAIVFLEVKKTPGNVTCDVMPVFLF